jgi:hypothetical protein
LEYRGELFREREKPAVGRRLLVPQGMNEAARGKAGTGDTGREPWFVDQREEAGDLVPTGALTGFTGIADEDDEEVQTVACGIDEAVGPTAEQIAEDGEKLEEQGGWMGFRVRRDGSDGESGEAVKGGWVKIRTRGAAGLWRLRWSVSREQVWRRRGLLFGLRLPLQSKKLGCALLYPCEGR